MNFLSDSYKWLACFKSCLSLFFFPVTMANLMASWECICLKSLIWLLASITFSYYKLIFSFFSDTSSSYFCGLHREFIGFISDGHKSVPPSDFKLYFPKGLCPGVTLQLSTYVDKTSNICMWKISLEELCSMNFKLLMKRQCPHSKPFLGSHSSDPRIPASQGWA